jgi:hypothetical protein
MRLALRAICEVTHEGPRDRRGKVHFSFLAREGEPMSTQSGHVHFTKGEAEAEVGKTLETGVMFPNVPKGTRGLVVATDCQNRNWLVVIKWGQRSRRRAGQGRYSWFTKDEMERILREAPP